MKLIRQIDVGSDAMLKEATEAMLDNRNDGQQVWLSELTVVHVQCTSLPGVTQVVIQDGDYAGRTAFIDCDAEVEE